MGKKKRWYRWLWAIPVLLALLPLYAWQLEPRLLVVKEEQVSCPGAPDGLRIAFFTDTHFGRHYNQQHAGRIVEKIEKGQPDLVIFGGDLLDAYYRDAALLDLEALAEVFQRLEPPLGCYAVWGNHDLGGGAARVYEEVLGNMGFQLLQNEAVSIPDTNITLIGLDDMLLGQPSFDWDSLPEDGVRILLSHEPDLVSALDSSAFSLALSGHSHGGQVSLPFLTSRILPTGARQYVKGWYDLDGASLFVSSGLGMTQLPFRLGNPPEICFITLHGSSE